MRGLALSPRVRARRPQNGEDGVSAHSRKEPYENTSRRVKDIVRRRRPEPEALGLNIVFEDDAIIALDKPPGMVVHPTYRNWSGTLLNGVLWHLRNRPGLTPHIVT